MDFVTNGGSLLVLGDHTDVFGLMRSFNSLLEGYGIKFKFDSAYHARRNWRGCTACAAGVLEHRWEKYEHGIAVGASLQLNGFARPLVIGRFGHSDTGERRNQMGSFLGNYRLDPNERIGDLPLVAQANIGKGRVLVFGDTSMLQGGVANYARHVILPLLEVSCRRPGITEYPIFRCLAALILVFLICTVFCGETAKATLVSCSFLIATLVSAYTFSDLIIRRPVIDKDSVLIGKSHFNNTGHYDLDLNPIGPLYSAIARCGFRSFDLEQWNVSSMMKARAICFVAPQRRFSTQQIADLCKFEQQGGIVILAAGFEDFEPSRPLLAAHALQLVDRPMGKVNYARGRDQANRYYPQLIDAWPVESINQIPILRRSDIDILLQYGEDASVVFCRKGQGGLLLFGDSRFFSAANIEKYPDFQWPGNVEFLKQLFIRFLKASPDRITDTFRSHPKPS
jgi:hypothetical protein